MKACELTTAGAALISVQCEGRRARGQRRAGVARATASPTLPMATAQLCLRLGSGRSQGYTVSVTSSAAIASWDTRPHRSERILFRGRPRAGVTSVLRALLCCSRELGRLTAQWRTWSLAPGPLVSLLARDKVTYQGSINFASLSYLTSRVLWLRAPCQFCSYTVKAAPVKAPA